ncbi:glycosyltransferase family 2 protein [Thermoleophilia bacterium SCSIO 60948]|nr:glycosyltransferase family 2 protein [Thermoleophilia bacterium SCSIO 60948]
MADPETTERKNEWTYPEPPPETIGRPLPLEVAFLGDEARHPLGDRVNAHGPGPSSWPSRLDLLIVDSASAADPAVLSAASERGARIVGLRRAGTQPSSPAGVELEIGDVAAGENALPLAPALDPTRFNPLLFKRDGVSGFWALVRPGADLDRLGEADELLAEAANYEPVTLRGVRGIQFLELPEEVIPGSSVEEDDPELQDALQKRLGILDHPAFHGSEWERAGWIAKLCASGMPVVVAGMSDRLRELLGPELSGLLEGVSAAALSDLDERERISVGLRRAALRNHSSIERWRQIAAFAGIEVPDRPKVSVVFATRREEWLPFGLAQIERQSYEPMELCVCLHGRRFFSEAAEQTIRDNYSGEFQVIWVDEELTLGDALNSGVAATDGELVTKMDDDDFYNVDHLWDLMLASEYSGAALVGKAAEFVYLDEIGVTVRQISQDVDTRMAGGGMMARRQALVAQRGWPLRTRGEDLAMIRMFNRNGYVIHRIPPHGYILNRHGRDHTWRPMIDYFLFRSERQWRGLRFDVTVIEEPRDMPPPP